MKLKINAKKSLRLWSESEMRARLFVRKPPTNSTIKITALRIMAMTRRLPVEGV
jgi:hypothetical protein